MGEKGRHFIGSRELDIKRFVRDRSFSVVKPGFSGLHKRKHKRKDQNFSFSLCLRLCLRSRALCENGLSISTTQAVMFIQ